MTAVYKGDTMPTPTHLTYDTVLNALEKAVADRGAGYVYLPRVHGTGTSCLYWHKDEEAPGCLVGTALHHLGLSGEVLDDFGPVNFNSLLKYPHFQNHLTVDPDAARLLATVQIYQDRQVPWGRALKQAVADVNVAKAAMRQATPAPCLKVTTEAFAKAFEEPTITLAGFDAEQYHAMIEKAMAQSWQLTNA